MISSHHAVDVGTACLKPTTRSSLHSTFKLSCQVRHNPSIGLVAGWLCVRPALPAAFCSRSKLAAARTICPECSSTSHNATAPQQEHASTRNKVQRKRQRPLLSYCCNSQQAPRQMTVLPICTVQAQQSFQEVQQQQQRHCHSAGTEQSEMSPAHCKSSEQSTFCILHLALQLLRIETEGAYAGLVAGSPIADDLDSASRSADIQPNAPARTLCALKGRQSHQQTSR